MDLDYAVAQAAARRDLNLQQAAEEANRDRTLADEALDLANAEAAALADLLALPTNPIIPEPQILVTKGSPFDDGPGTSAASSGQAAAVNSVVAAGLLQRLQPEDGADEPLPPAASGGQSTPTLATPPPGITPPGQQETALHADSPADAVSGVMMPPRPAEPPDVSHPPIFTDQDSAEFRSWAAHATQDQLNAFHADLTAERQRLAGLERLTQLGKLAYQLMEKIQQAEMGRRDWVFVTAELPDGPIAVPTGEIAYAEMSVSEKLWREELEYVIQRLADLELKLKTTYEDEISKPVITAGPQQTVVSRINEWLESGGDAGSLNVLFKAGGRGTRDLIAGLYVLVTDLPGVGTAINQTLLNATEDPSGFWASVQAAMDKRAEQLGNGDIAFGYNQMMMDVVAGEVAGLGVGKLSKVALLKLISKTRQKLQLLKAAKEAAEFGRMAPGDASDAAAYPGSTLPLSANATGEFGNLLKRYGYDVQMGNHLKSWTRHIAKLVYLSKETGTIGTLVDEFLHVWNHGRKGDFLPETLADLHRKMGSFALEKGTDALSKIHWSFEDIYHHLELMNFMNSGRRLPEFMKRIPIEELERWAKWAESLIDSLYKNHSNPTDVFP